jgi:hypothetical protein
MIFVDPSAYQDEFKTKHSRYSRIFSDTIGYDRVYHVEVQQINQSFHQFYSSYKHKESIRFI